MKKMIVHKAYSFKEAQEFDIKFWRRAGTFARFATAWMMVEEYLKKNKKYAYKPRLRRTVQNIERIQG